MKYLKLYEEYNPFETALRKMVKELEPIARVGFTVEKPDITTLIMIHLTVNSGVTSVPSDPDTHDDFYKLHLDHQKLVRRFDDTLKYLVANSVLDCQEILQKYSTLTTPEFNIYWSFRTPERTNCVETNVYLNGIFLTKYLYPLAELAFPVNYKSSSKFDL